MAAVCFAIAIALAHAPIVFLGRTLLPSENHNPLDYRHTEANYGPGFVRPEEWSSRGIHPHANLHDPGGSWWQGEPALEFFGRAVRSGQFPFWDPSAAAGAPAYTNLTSEFLFPPQVLLSLAGATSVQKNFYVLGLFWAAGFATYCLLRKHAVGVIGSGAGGLIFMLSGAMQQFGPSIFMGQVVACIPLVALITRWYFDAPTWRRSVGLAFVYACVSLASFPPILFMAFGFAVLLFACLVATHAPGRVWPTIFRYSVAVVVSVGLVAVYYLPAIETVRQAKYATIFYRTAGLDTLDITSLFDLFSPTAFGGPNIYLRPVLSKIHTANLFYVGATALLLVPFAFGKSANRARPLVIASAVAAILVLLKVFGVRPVHWIALLPGLQTFHYATYFGILLAFLLALLAGIGLDRLMRQEARWLALAIAVATVGGGLVALWLVADAKGAFRYASAWRWLADYRLLVVVAGLAGLFVSAAMFAKQAGLKLALGLLLLALIFTEGTVNASYPRQKRWDVFANPPRYIREVQEIAKGSRLFIGAVLNANLGSAFGIETLDSLYMFVPPRIFEFYEKYTASSAAVSMREATMLPPERVLERAGIGFLLIRQHLPVLFGAASRRGYPFAYQDDYVALFKREPAPRYLFSSDYQVVSRDEALNLISTAPSGQVVLEAKPPFEAAPNTPGDPQPEVRARKLNSLRLTLNAPRAGLLYIADSHYTGWSATVNDVPAPILLANFAFRAVPVPPGAVTVELSYLPVGFRTGLAVSLISLAAAVFLLTRKEQAAVQPRK